jgi:hypothetical protein
MSRVRKVQLSIDEAMRGCTSRSWKRSLTGDGKKGRLRLGEILQEIPEIYREEEKTFFSV